MPTQSVRVPTGDGDLSAYLALPDSSDGLRAGVLVLHELFGLNDDIRRIARRFAEHGYVALAPDLYSVGPRAKPICIRRTMRALRSGSGRAFDDIEAARAWLAERMMMSTSRGWRWPVSAWAAGLRSCTRRGRRSAWRLTFYGAVPREVEALEGICPVFAGYGERDRVFVGQAERLRGHLDELGVEHEINVYSGAGHSFMNQYRGLQSLFVRFSPMSVGHHEESAESAWATMLEFFERNLDGTTEAIRT